MGPEFICIGAQRSGTTWLHHMLSQHPQLWMTPVKELNYFDDPKRSRYFKDLRRRWEASKLLTQWDLRYFLGRPGDKWYASLFSAAQERGLIAGEASPSYAIMGDDAFARIRALNPDTKLLFLMRDPIERSWSNYMLEVKKNRLTKKSGADQYEEAIKYCLRPRKLARSKYIETIDVIERHFPADQIFYGFYDDLSERPQWFAEQILMFLGVDASMASTIIPDHNVNPAAKGTAVPREFELALAPHLLPGLQRLADRFDTYPALWLKRIQSLATDRAG